ncbi:MAG: calcium/sodium antiporter [Balneolaceae bacterium]
MLYPLIALLFGLFLLIWSADRFVEASAATVRHFGMPPLVIGMVVIGFGTSAPEMVVSAISSLEGNPGIALGNAYGSNISNIALILGITALMIPVRVHSRVLRRELPILIGVTALAAWQVWDGEITRADAVVLMILFAGLMGWSVWQGYTQDEDPFSEDIDEMVDESKLSLKQSLIRLVLGLLVLIASSRLLVWGAVDLALMLGIHEMVIGLTVVAIGTSLPELASTLAAVKKGEHDMALGNIIGSNLFNTLAVVGIAGMIHPMTVEPEVFSRDMLVMAGLTVILFVMGFSQKGIGKGRVNRFEGGLLIASFLAYTIYLVVTTLPIHVIG